MNHDRMVPLMEYNTLDQAEMAKSILEESGIWTMINNEFMSTIYPTGIVPAQLIIMEEDLARAKRILEESLISEDVE
ncbi:MAG: DUF2007 domain-containing protein [Rikenellaceae bacterium]